MDGPRTEMDAVESKSDSCLCKRYSMLLQLLSEDAGFHSPGSGTRLGIIQHCRSIADEGSVDDLR